MLGTLSLVLAGTSVAASWAQAPASERPCGLRLQSGRLAGVPAFAVPARGRAIRQRQADGWLRCRLEHADGTRFAEAYVDARRRVLEMRFFRRNGKLLVSIDTLHAAAGSAARAQKVACGSAAQASITDAYWRGTRNWWIGSTAPGLPADKVVKAVRDAQSQWTNNINWCGFKDEANPPATYKGRTSKKVGQDGQGTVDWGAMGDDQTCAGALACTATWYDGKGHPAESDIRFNTAFKWSTGSGDGSKYDIHATAAHEIGHLYQFDHVTNSSRNDETSVMWPYQAAGDTSGRKLGKGDSQADNKHY